MSKKSQGLTRRELIAQSVKGLGLLGISSALSNVIVQSIAESAFAQSTVLASKKYIYFFLEIELTLFLFKFNRKSTLQNVTL